jgi:hypothetical protein
MRFTLDTVGKLDWPQDRQGRPIYPEGFEDLAAKMQRPSYHAFRPFVIAIELDGEFRLVLHNLKSPATPLERILSRSPRSLSLCLARQFS